MNARRDCPHAFPCWYRLQGRCCYSGIEDMATCTGHQASAFYVRLRDQGRIVSRTVCPGEDRPSSERLVPLPRRE